MEGLNIFIANNLWSLCALYITLFTVYHSTCFNSGKFSLLRLPTNVYLFFRCISFPSGADGLVYRIYDMLTYHMCYNNTLCSVNALNLHYIGFSWSLPSNQSFYREIAWYRRGVGHHRVCRWWKGGQLPTKWLSDSNWGEFDHASHSPQLQSDNYYVHYIIVTM